MNNEIQKTESKKQIKISVFAFCEIIIYLFYTIFLLQDYSGIEMKDTCLFYLGGHSVGLQHYKMIDLSPLAIGIMYLVFLAIIIVSLVRFKSFAPLYFVNLIYAVLLLMFYTRYLPYYPPFGFDEETLIPILMFIELSYIAILISIVGIGRYI